MNKVCITGRIANELELKKTQTDKSVMEFGLAVKRDRKNANGEYPVDFIRVNAWEHNADYLSKYAQKGSMIGVTGRIETNTYENREGKKITNTFVQAESVEILLQPQKDSSNFGGKQSKSAQSVGIEPDELPFY